MSGKMSGHLSCSSTHADKHQDICLRSDVLFFRDKCPDIVGDRWYI